MSESGSFRATAREYRGIGTIAIVLAIAPFFLIGPGMTHQAQILTTFLLFAILTVALNIAFGHTNQLFLFVGALMGVGAYATAIPADNFGISPWFLLPASALTAGVLGLLVSYVSARRGMTVIVIAILTLALQLAFEQAFEGARGLTGGTTGFHFSGLEVDLLTDSLGMSSHVAHYYVVLVFLLGALALYQWMMHSKYGLAYKAIRQDEIAAEAVGIDVVRYKVVAGFTAAAIIGLTGPLYGQLGNWIVPSDFTFQTIDVMVLVMLVLGGMRTLAGPVVGAALIIYINEQLQGVGQWRTAVFGLLLIVLFLYFREGIVPKARELWHHDRGRAYAGAIRDRLS